MSERRHTSTLWTRDAREVEATASDMVILSNTEMLSGDVETIGYERHSVFPDIDTLRRGLTLALCDDGRAGQNVEILARAANEMVSTFASERVVCRIGGRTLRLFCKYGVGRDSTETDAAPAELRYEIDVYRNLLDHLDLTTPRYHGAVLESVPNAPWLIIESIEGASPLDLAPDQNATLKASSWVGAFHEAPTQLMEGPRADFIRRLDLSDYVGATEGNASLAGLRWLDELYKRYRDLAPALMDDSVLIHGQYYPQNILLRSGSIWPVDWQHACVAAGEIDLATLTDGWPRGQVTKIVDQYVRARKWEFSHARFQIRFQAARIYLQLKWLATEPERLGALRVEARQLGIRTTSEERTGSGPETLGGAG